MRESSKFRTVPPPKNDKTATKLVIGSPYKRVRRDFKGFYTLDKDGNRNPYVDLMAIEVEANDDQPI